MGHTQARCPKPDVMLPFEPTQTGPLLDSADSAGGGPMEDDVLLISGAGHWFLDGWIGDHVVRLFVSIAGSCWSTGGDIGMHLKGHYAVLMGPVSWCPDALTVWYRSWDC